MADYAHRADFTPRERAALAYAEMVTIAPNDVSDAQFAELRRLFSDREVVELTALAAVENFRARFTRPLQIASDDFASIPTEKLPSALG